VGGTAAEKKLRGGVRGKTKRKSGLKSKPLAGTGGKQTKGDKPKSCVPPQGKKENRKRKGIGGNVLNHLLVGCGLKKGYSRRGNKNELDHQEAKAKKGNTSTPVPVTGGPDLGGRVVKKGRGGGCTPVPKRTPKEGARRQRNNNQESAKKGPGVSLQLYRKKGAGTLFLKVRGRRKKNHRALKGRGKRDSKKEKKKSFTRIGSTCQERGGEKR